MPNIPKPKRLPWQQPKAQAGTNQKFYNSTRQRKQSIAWRKENPLCEVCLNNGIVKPVIQKGKRVGVMDHLIPIEKEGAKYNSLNFMSMCDPCHNKKRNAESKGQIIEYIETEEGRIPKDRTDVFKLLNNKQ